MKMKILLVSPNFPPPQGGSPRYTEQLCTALREHAYLTVHLVAVSRVPRRTKDTRLVLDRRMRRGGRAVTYLTAALAAMAEAVRLRPEITHAVTWRSAVPIAFLPRCIRGQLVVSILGTEFGRAGRLLRTVRGFVIRRAERLIAISNYTADTVRATEGRSPVVIEPAIHVKRVRASALGEEGESGRRYADKRAADGLQVISVGRLDPRKGHDQLIAAIGKLQAEGLTMDLTIVGTGPDEGRLNALGIRLCRTPPRIVAALEKDVDLYRLMASADVFALLTRSEGSAFEGFGIAFVEAAALGLPVVAGNSGGALEAVDPGRTALVVSDQTEAVAALRDLAHDSSLREALGDAGRRWSEQFDWSAVINKYVRTYQSIARKPQSDCGSEPLPDFMSKPH